MVDKDIKLRILGVMLFFTFAVFILVIRIGWLQLIDGKEYKEKVSQQYYSGKNKVPQRGVIYDRNSKELAISVIAYNIAVNPLDVNNKNKLSKYLSETLNLDIKSIAKKLEKSDKYEIIKKKVSESVGEKIIDYKNKNGENGLMIEKTIKREYPKNNLASHVIGFTGTDNQGLSGIEYMMESNLRGSPILSDNEKDRYGNDLPFLDEVYELPKDGVNIVLTIDEAIQHFAESALETAVENNKVVNGGVAIVMDPNNGDILAMVSKPDFNLNTPFDKPIIDKYKDVEWKNGSGESINILQKTTWRNKAISDTYEPGSTFKTITSAIAMQEGKVKLDDKYKCWPIDVHGNTISCWSEVPHGEETFEQAVYNSCNPVFVEVAQKVGKKTFYEYIKSFGFYDKTNIGLPGEANSIIHSEPTDVDLAVASFGQRFQVTPIQMITSYAAVANGGNLLKPKLIKEIRDKNNKVIKKNKTEVVRTVISEEVSNKLCNVLEGVVSKGTGTNAFVGGYRVAGKTGTSETTVEGQYVASFSAIAPADNPKICVLVVLDNPRGPSHFGGVIAAPVAGKIVEDTLIYMGVKREYKGDNNDKNDNIEVPDVRNVKISKAINILKEKGFNVKIGNSNNDDESGIVIEQMPKPYDKVSKGSVIMIYNKGKSETDKVEVPNLANLSLEQAKNILISRDLNIKYSGSGIVREQSVSPGKKIQRGTGISVELIINIGD